MGKLWLSACVVLIACGPVKPAPPEPPRPFATERGTPTGAMKSVQLGPAGGALASDDGRVKLEVPAGALAAPSTLTLEPITCFAPGCLAEAWRFGPEGTTFSAPVTLRFQVAAAVLERRASLGALGVAYQDGEGYWHWLEDVVRDEATNTLVVTTLHLSDWSPLQGIQLRPLTAAVKEGQSVTLEVKLCVPETTDGGLTTLMSNCDGDLAPLGGATDWSVNGQAGGNGTVGTVSAGSALNATYQAPSKAPKPPTVAVTAKVPGGWDRFSNVTLFSQITVGTAANFTGTLKIGSSTTFPVPTAIQVNDATLTLADDGSDETNYDLDGTAEMMTKFFMLGDVPCTLRPEEAKKPIGGQNFKVKKDPATVRFGYVEGFLYECLSSTGATQFSITVVFSTSAGGTCGIPADVPINDITAPSGQYAGACGTAEWTFTKSQ